MQVIFLENTEQVNEFTERLRSATLQELVDSYNSQVGNPGWVSAKGRFLHALYHEFKRREIDITVIDSGAGLRLDKRIVLDVSGKRVMIAVTR